MNVMKQQRSDHQPADKPHVPDIPADQVARACAGAVVFVLATDDGCEPLRVPADTPDAEDIVCDETPETPRPLQTFEGMPVVARAVQCAASTSPQAVFVLAAPEIEDAVRRAADAVSAAHQTPVMVVPLDLERERRDTMQAQGFELFGITAGTLKQALEMADLAPEAQELLFLACDQVRITPWHLAQLVQAAHATPAPDAVTSWIAWLRRLPMLVNRRLIEDIDASAFATGNGAVSRPVPNLRVAEVVFGEQRLDVNAVPPDAVTRFFTEASIGAREAVRRARDERKPDDSQGGASHDASARAGERPQPDNADSLLADAARRVVSQLESQLAPDELSKVERADKWARRNRADFPLLADKRHESTLAYLDSAATSQRLYATLQAQANFDQHENANVYRGGYDLSLAATASLNDARAVLEAHIGAQRRETVFTANTTDSANLVAHAWGTHNVGAGDLVVVAASEHHSNLVPWMMLANRSGAQVAYVPVQGDGRLDMQAFAQLLQQKPKLVCVSHISNVLGIEAPVAAMAQQAHEVGARLFLDAAQSAAHLPIDVGSLGADFVAFSAHKMYGPMGIGCLWISPEAFAEMDPVSGGGGAISHVGEQSYYLRKGAIQYELGTPAVSQAIGWGAAIRHLDQLGFDAIKAHDAILTRYLVAGLATIPDITVWGDHGAPDGQHGLVSFSIAGVAPAAIGQFCGKLGVAVRAGGHCALPLGARMGVVGTARISIGIHTTREDIEAALAAVALCRKLYRETSNEPTAAPAAPTPDAATMADSDAAPEPDATPALKDEAVPAPKMDAAPVFEPDAAPDAPAPGAATTPKPVAGLDTADTGAAYSATKVRNEHIRAHYAEVAQHAECPLGDDPAHRGEAAKLYDVAAIEGIPDAALAASRGCGDPVAVAQLQPGESVLDLGCGGGIDALIAARQVGRAGLVIGLDMTAEMIELARANAQAASAGNVEFIEGDIEDIPLPDSSVSVVISNCVVNLCDDKWAVFAEARRVLADGGRIVVSDIVAFGPIPDQAQDALAAITGCRNGIPQAADYEQMLRECGFEEVLLEPKTIYTYPVLREKAQRKNLSDEFATVRTHDAGGLCGSVIVRAFVPKAPTDHEDAAEHGGTEASADAAHAHQAGVTHADDADGDGAGGAHANSTDAPVQQNG